MLSLKSVLKNNKNVICFDYDEENEVISFVNKATDMLYQVQVYNNEFYMVTIMDDCSGDEICVKYFKLHEFKNLKF